MRNLIGALGLILVFGAGISFEQEDWFNVVIMLCIAVGHWGWLVATKEKSDG